MKPVESAAYQIESKPEFSGNWKLWAGIEKKDIENQLTYLRHNFPRSKYRAVEVRTITTVKRTILSALG